MRWLPRALALVSILSALTLGGGPLHAQEPDAAPAGGSADTPDDRATSFRAVTGSEAEGVPGGTLLIASYGLIWLFLMLYLRRVGRLSAAVRADVERLSGALEARSESQGEA